MGIVFLFVKDKNIYICASNPSPLTLFPKLWTAFKQIRAAEQWGMEKEGQKEKAEMLFTQEEQIQAEFSSHSQSSLFTE